MVLARKSARGERRTPTLGYTGSAFLQHLRKLIKVLLNRSFLHGRRGDNSCPQNVLLTCRKESESCFVCLGCESSYYSMHGLHYHLNRTRYMRNKQGVEGKSPPKSCKKSTTFFRHFFILNGIYMYFLFCFETFHLFNWPSPMPVPKRKMSCSQPELLAHNILYLMFGRQ